MLPCRFQQCLGTVKTLTLEVLPNQELSVIQVTTLLGPHNLQNIEAMKLIFYFKMRKILLRIQNAINISGKAFGFSNNGV